MESTQDLSCGRTCLEHSVQTKEMIFEPCLKKSQKPKFQYLKLDTTTKIKNGALAGQTPEWSEAVAVKSLGEPWMPNIGESPSAEDASILSQILQAGVQAKYYLSQKACLGILRRAAARSKKLPEVLRVALEKQAQSA